MSKHDYSSLMHMAGYIIRDNDVAMARQDIVHRLKKTQDVKWGKWHKTPGYFPTYGGYWHCGCATQAETNLACRMCGYLRPADPAPEPEYKYGRWSKPNWACNCETPFMYHDYIHCDVCDTYRPMNKPGEPGNK